MNKADLREAWGKYCNTDKLVDDMIALLTAHGHNNSEHGVCTILNTYFTNKEPLIQLIATSKNYAGDMRIITKRKFDRIIDANDVYSCVKNFDAIGLDSLLEYKDKNGKTMFEYLTTGTMNIDLEHLPDAETQTAKRNQLGSFVYHNGATKESNEKRQNVYAYLDAFKYINYSKLQKDLFFSDVKKVPVLKAGTKTSRAFNKVCHIYGIDKLNPQTVQVNENGQTVEKTVYPYDKLFAAYADVVSDLERNMYFIISLNPLDYLTMSMGVNWHSCHSISHGGWKGGCLSYMLDTTSIITYVLTDLEDSLHEVPKVYRQMFHYDNGLFMQNRLYPQGNDGAVNLYDKFRNIMVEEFKDILNDGEEWEVEIGTDKCKAHVYSTGTHYVDYTSRSDCSIFYAKKNSDKIRNHIMTVGHDGICTRCGRKHSSSGSLHHTRRSECII